MHNAKETIAGMQGKDELPCQIWWDRPLVKQSAPNEIHGLQMPLEDQRKISDFIPGVLKHETRGMGRTLSEARVAP